ncbi:MAG TPA: DUF4139 domain-containing protein [Puia sp.]|nr:DUF4139 domain-containing protein [Puia sp.]
MNSSLRRNARRTPVNIFTLLFIVISITPFLRAIAGDKIICGDKIVRGNKIICMDKTVCGNKIVRGDGDKISVTSVLRSATVYRTGAELTHEAIATLHQGNNELVIGDVSNNIDVSSIQVGCPGDVTIMSVEFSKEFLKAATKSALIQKLEDSLETNRKEQEKIAVLMQADNDLLELLKANKEIRGTNTGLSVSELMKMMDYYKQKSLELQNELSLYKEKEVRLKKLAAKLESQIREEDKLNTITSGRIVLQLLSPDAGSYNFTVSYLTPTAYWNPSYDLRVVNINTPLKLLYKAKLVQTSGIDWRQVKLTLSTSVPNQQGNAPVLRTWFLSYTDPVAAMEKDFRSNTIQSIAFKLRNNFGDDQADKSSVGGLLKKTVLDSNSLDGYISVRDNEMNVVFDIDIPYDIPSNGKEQNVVLKEYEAPSTYKYYSAPRLDKDAYLLGELPDWGKLNLLPGEANIIFEGTYIGKSFIDPNSTQDTLNLTLGRDKRVVVKREKLVDYSSVKFMGSNKKQILTYEITVKNNKKEKLQMLLKDQYPLSTDKEIEGELLDSSGAEVNKETGVLTWKLQLAPGESKKFRISYSVKYPKDKLVNIN